MELVAMLGGNKIAESEWECVVDLHSPASILDSLELLDIVCRWSACQVDADGEKIDKYVASWRLHCFVQQPEKEKQHPYAYPMGWDWLQVQAASSRCVPHKVVHRRSRDGAKEEVSVPCYKVVTTKSGPSNSTEARWISRQDFVDAGVLSGPGPTASAVERIIRERARSEQCEWCPGFVDSRVADAVAAAAKMLRSSPQRTSSTPRADLDEDGVDAWQAALLWLTERVEVADTSTARGILREWRLRRKRLPTGSSYALLARLAERREEELLKLLE